MNMLFGTDFSVMVAKTGRKQTTLGVWVGLSPPDEGEQRDTDTVMVLDVEGTDSRERGEDHGAFERKTSLFSLALSEILIINMWTTDIGLHDGANYGLLKIVFELNLQLFQASNNGNKTLLLFLFRDHTLPEDDEHTPLDYFVGVITEDMAKIWDSISKPEAFASSKVTDFFDFRFVSLPHKVHKSKEFKRQVEELKHRFLDPANPDRLLSKNYKKDIPADGFAKYAENIWSVIQENKDLNIPTQKEMLSMFRCEQMAATAYEHFVSQLEAINQILDKGSLVQTFGSRIAAMVEAAYEEYDPSAKRYVATVAAAKRLELTEKMALAASKLLRIQLRLAADIEIAALNDQLKSRIFSQKAPIANFSQVITEISDATISSFERIRADCEISTFAELSTYTTAAEGAEFERTVRDRVKAVRRDQFLALRSTASKAFERNLSAWVSSYLEGGGSKSTSNSCPAPVYVDPNEASSSTPTPTPKLTESSSTVKVTPGLVQTWDEIQAKYEAARQKFITEMETYTTQLLIEETEAKQELDDARAHCVTVLAKIFQDLTSNVAWLMERRFSAMFKLTEDRMPRRWTPGDDLSGEFKKACLQAERLLDQVSVLRLDPQERGFSWLDVTGSTVAVKADIDAVPEALAIMSSTDVSRTLEQFRDKARGDYLQAAHAQETAVKGSYTIMVALIIFLIFGWDEVMYLLSNPFALFIVVVGAGAAFAAYHLGLFPVITPVVNTFVAAISQAIAGGLQQGAAAAAQRGQQAPTERPGKEKLD